MTPFVDVAVVLWRSAPYTEALFQGLETLDYPRDAVRIHFVDNGCGDGSLDAVRAEMRRREGHLPPIVIHEPGVNTGFSGGNNLVIKHAIEEGHPYVYLLNPDAEFEPGALREAVRVAESDPTIGSVQSLLVLQQEPGTVNAWGNEIHALGFGYCAGYKAPRASAPRGTTEIAYASGAGALYRTAALRKIGLLDEVLFAYHEDLDLGWRLWLAGYRNVLASESVVRHRYEFSRSIAKWYWMERNRWLVILKNYRLGTLAVLFPFLVAAEFGLLLFSVPGGWWKEKLRTYLWFLRPGTWSYLLAGRRAIRSIRTVPDSAMLARFTTDIAYQEYNRNIVTRIGNPAWRAVMRVIRAVVVW